MTFGIEGVVMKLYELTDVCYADSDGSRLADGWEDKIGRKGYFVGEVGFDLCLMFAYRMQSNTWGFISAPVRSISGEVNKTDLSIVTDNLYFNFTYAETSED